MNASFSVGEQPCSNFRERMETPGDRRVCRQGEPWCAKLVSFCENCSRDHHQGGAETCRARTAP